MSIKIIDCTLRDGGYYNNWDFDHLLVDDYLACMKSIGVDYVEIGFRSLLREGFKGAFAYSTDDFLMTLNIPEDLKIGIMINAAELFSDQNKPNDIIKKLVKPSSQIKLIRIASHLSEFKETLTVTKTLKDMGYLVGVNLMQISEADNQEVISLAKEAAKWPLDILYFADSLGSLDPKRIKEIIKNLRKGWKGDLGIHTHDNMGLAMVNTATAVEEGVNWIDSTVTGMGRGPGNAKTEYTILEFEELRNMNPNLERLSDLISNKFKAMQDTYGWGTNPFYYLAGKYKIHPTYIQEMLNDKRYETSDVLSLINHLREVGGKKFSHKILDTGRQIYSSTKGGSWDPKKVFKDKNVLIIGAGPSLQQHKEGLEQFIGRNKPVVVGLNTKETINESLIDLRAACHPMRIVADCDQYHELKQPIVMPFGQLPTKLKDLLSEANVLDYGLCIEEDTFHFGKLQSTIPLPLVIAYVLAFVTAGGAKKVFLAGFDGFETNDSRSSEMNQIFSAYLSTSHACSLVSITPTKNNIPSSSLYAL